MSAEQGAPAPQTEDRAAPVRKPWRQQLRGAWWHVRKVWAYLTGFHTFRSWHTNALRDARRLSDRTVGLLWLCAVVALLAWWRTLQTSQDLAAAGLVFAVVFVATWYAWNVLSTVRRDRSRLIRRLRAKTTAALRKPELLQPQRGSVLVGKAQGFHRGVKWERFTAYVDELHALYPATLLNDGDPKDRERVEAVTLAELEGLDERSKTWRRYGFSWHPSASEYVVKRADRVPDYLPASEETLIHPDGAVLGQTGQGMAVWPFNEHLFAQGSTNAGKSVFLRHLVLSAIRGGHVPGGVYLFDGLEGENFGGLAGREGVICVADQRHMWGPAFDEIAELVAARYRLARQAARSHGQIPKPRFPRVLVVMDESQNFVKDFGDLWEKFVREARAANVWFVASTQRGDIGSAFPSGATRDQYGALVGLGRLKGGAEMMFGKGSDLVAVSRSLEPIQGRFLAFVNGQVSIGQTPFMPTDHDPANPWAAALYPPLVSSELGFDDGGHGFTLAELEDDGGLSSPSTSPQETDAIDAEELDPEEVDAILEREQRRVDEIVAELENPDDDTDVDALSRELDVILGAIEDAGLSDVQDDDPDESNPAPTVPDEPKKPAPGSRVEEDY